MAEAESITNTNDVTASTDRDVRERSREDTPSLESRMCIVGQKLMNDRQLMAAAKSFGIPVVSTENPEEYIDDPSYDTGFVVEEFEGDIYDLLCTTELRIWGPTMIIQYAEQNKRLPHNNRPLYCNSMRNVVVCFTGFRQKEHLSRLVTMIHNMGGSIRKDFKMTVTHLIAQSTGNQKYNYALTLGIPVMVEDWVYRTWERRHEPEACATEESLMQYKMKPFHQCRVSFFGFTPEEQAHMEELTLKNGGEVTNVEDESCTHIVFEDQQSSGEMSSPDDQTRSAVFVKAEWFWASIQMDGCANEKLYLHQQDQALMSPHSRSTHLTPSTPGSRQRKRKRLKETLGQLAQMPLLDVAGAKRHSTDFLASSVNNSFLDATTSPDRSCGDLIGAAGGHLSPTSMKSPLPVDLKNMTARQQVCVELLQTESNYVGILNTIVTLFKDPLEATCQVGGPLLDPTDVRIIFGNLQPIFDVHQRIRDDLVGLVTNWKEDCSVGNVILEHSQDLLKAYPPFVNFFEKTKEVLLHCDRTKPRFHAFLKICQSKPECGRQPLMDLLIRPVQRLPSVILLLNDLVKHTNKSNPDHGALEEAVKSLKEVLTQINEDKRKTEGQFAMFDIVNDIENCPPTLLSSFRTFIAKADMVELINGSGDQISGKGENLTMFLFSDILEICKRRTKYMGTLKSPGSSLNLAASAKSQQKCYKHLFVITISSIKCVVDVTETEDCKNVFALVCRSNQELKLKERLYSFALSPEVNKSQFLKMLCRHLANTICMADSEKLLECMEAQKLEINTSEVTTNSISKAMSRLASKTSKRVGRAFSFNRTPHRSLKRTMSTMFSSPFQSPPSIDERSVSNQCVWNHANRSTLRSRLSFFPSASTADLHQETDSPPAKIPVKISKKLKSSSLGASSSKLL